MGYILRHEANCKEIVIPGEILTKFNLIQKDFDYEIDGDQNFIILKIVKREEKEVQRAGKKTKGILSKYKNPSLIQEESQAWSRAAEENYEDN